MRPLAYLVVAAIASAASPSVAHEFRAGAMEIDHPWTRATPPAARVGGGYLKLKNESAAPDRILGGSSAVAGKVEIHLMEMNDGIMKMRPVPGGVEIPAGGTVEFAPGGYHLMLMELKKPIVEGEMIPVTIEFEKAGKVDIELAAGPAGGPASAAVGSDTAHGEHD